MERNETGHEPKSRGTAKTIPELGINESEIERVADMSAIELEAFMNEPVTIYLHKGRDIGDLDVETPSVNGINQPIVRGRETTIKRKYVEALARCTTSRYVQIHNQLNPENNQMIETKMLSYPFDVRRDTAKGRAWLELINATV